MSGINLSRVHNDPTKFYWTGTFTDSVTLAIPVPADILQVEVTQLSAAAPGVDAFTYAYTAGRAKRDEFTVYSWETNAAPGTSCEVEVVATLGRPQT